MKNNKAKKIATFRDTYFTTIEYEYRGERYDVTYANSYQVINTPAWIQHRDAQARIDEMKDNPKPVVNEETKSWEGQMDEIWEMLGW